VSVDRVASAILALKFAYSEIELKEIHAIRRLSLFENMLLLSVMLRFTEAHRRRFMLPLELIVARNSHTWAPWVEAWNNESWDYVATYTTRIWRSLYGMRINSQDLKEEMLAIIDGLKRISRGEEPMSERYRGNGQLTWDSKWRLLCLSVDVESTEAKLAPLLGKDVDLTQVIHWLNRSPLFVLSPISKPEIVVALRLLQQLLCPRPEGTLTVPSTLAKRPSTESLDDTIKRNKSQGN
jgi:hypothetical protein